MLDPRRPHPGRSPGRLLRRALPASSLRAVPREIEALAWLLVLSLLSTGLLVLEAELTPVAIMTVPMVLASLVLGPRLLPGFIMTTLFLLAVAVATRPVVSVRTGLGVLAVAAVGVIVMGASFRRTSLGVAGTRGESMLVDLRDRILRQGSLPALPDDWYAAAELRSSGGTLFAGDFVVAVRDGDRFDVAVVDVSGKGESAGTRALLLSGALGGLLGALPPSEFLPAANEFLMRQEWDEGFATAVHLTLDLATGAYVVRTAGHPPAAHRFAGSGRWRVLDSSGPILGLMPDPEFGSVAGIMASGDAMLLYTDGLVETRQRDISLGIDRMLGQSERLLRGRFDGGAARLIEAMGARDDDRALLLVHRR